MMENEFELKRIFEEALLEIEQGAGLREILAKEEGFSDDLKSLLKTDSLLRAHLIEREPSTAFTQSLEASLLESINETYLYRSQKRIYHFTLESMSNMAKIAVALVVTFMIFSGAAAASMKSLPTSPLYALKKGAESARLAMALNQESKARLHIKFAETRLNEAESMIESDQDGQFQETLMKEFEENLHSAESLAKDLAAEGKVELMARADDLNEEIKLAADLASTGSSLDASAEEDAGLLTEQATQDVAAVYQKASMAALDIRDLVVDNASFSPNGDGIKDSVKISFKAKSGHKFKLLLLRGDIVFSSGKIFSEDGQSGYYYASWLGSDESGAPLENGAYTLKVEDGFGRSSQEGVRVVLDTAAPVFDLTFPFNEEVISQESPTFAFTPVGDAANYKIQLAKSADLRSSEVYSFVRKDSSSYRPDDSTKLTNGKWYWRVICTDQAGNTSSTVTRTFILGPGQEE